MYNPIMQKENKIQKLRIGWFLCTLFSIGKEHRQTKRREIKAMKGVARNEKYAR